MIFKCWCTTIVIVRVSFEIHVKHKQKWIIIVINLLFLKKNISISSVSRRHFAWFLMHDKMECAVPVRPRKVGKREMFFSQRSFFRHLIIYNHWAKYAKRAQYKWKPSKVTSLQDARLSACVYAIYVCAPSTICYRDRRVSQYTLENASYTVCFFFF